MNAHVPTLYLMLIAVNITLTLSVGLGMLSLPFALGVLRFL